MTHKLSLKNHERLKSKVVIDSLFSIGQTEFSYPLKAIFVVTDLKEESEWPLKMGVTVPKKKVKLAVNRNLIKRRIREAYRLNKLPLQSKLSTHSSKSLNVMFIYIEKEPKDYKTIEKGVIKLLKKLEARLS